MMQRYFKAVAGEAFAHLPRGARWALAELASLAHKRGGVIDLPAQNDTLGPLMGLIDEDADADALFEPVEGHAPALVIQPLSDRRVLLFDQWSLLRNPPRASSRRSISQVIPLSGSTSRERPRARKRRVQGGPDVTPPSPQPTAPLDVTASHVTSQTVTTPVTTPVTLPPSAVTSGVTRPVTANKPKSLLEATQSLGKIIALRYPAPSPSQAVTPPAPKYSDSDLDSSIKELIEIEKFENSISEECSQQVKSARAREASQPASTQAKDIAPATPVVMAETDRDRFIRVLIASGCAFENPKEAIEHMASTLIAHALAVGVVPQEALDQAIVSVRYGRARPKSNGLLWRHFKAHLELKGKPAGATAPELPKANEEAPRAPVERGALMDLDALLGNAPPQFTRELHCHG